MRKWADVQVGVEVFLPDDLAAVLTLHPQAFRPDTFLRGGFNL
jgi:hypothetical protein